MEENTDNSLSNFSNAGDQAGENYQTVLGQIAGLGSLATGTAPIFTGSGSHIFTANIYGRTVTIDLSMFADLKQYFDILFTLILAYLNFKIYRYILEILLKIGA